MKTATHTSLNHAIYDMRGGGLLLRHWCSGEEVFFQPGDDAGSMRESLDALDELPEGKWAVVFDMLCAQYL